jgi:hypothetical protein
MSTTASRGRRRRRAPAAIAVAAVLAGALYGFAPIDAGASSHREAPLTAADPAVDNTDLYAFVSKDRPGYVNFVANWIPFEEPNGGPNFYPFATDASYYINVDNNGDARPDARFRWTFRTQDRRGTGTFLYNNGPVTSLDDENLLVRQIYTLESSFNGAPFKTRISGAPVAPSRTGRASMPDYGKLRDQAVVQLPGGWKIFAGQADDPFFLDLRVFDLLYGGDLSETGQDTLAGYNVNTIVLQVPFKDVALGGDAARNPVIGVWTTTDRPRVRITGGGSYGGQVQVSRLGNPLVNEVVVPNGLKDAFNASSPDRDAKNPTLVKRVTEPEVPKLIQAIYGIPAPATPRNDLAEIFLTGITTKAGGPIKADLNSQLNNADVSAAGFVPSEQLRLNLGVPIAGQPNRLGVLGGDLQGFPNGRRLTDDVVDIELQALVGAAQTGKLIDALAAGDKVDANDQAFGAAFPYVALPNGVGVNTAGSGSAAGSGAGGMGGFGGATQPAPSTSDKPSAEAPAPSLTPAGYAGNTDSGQVPMAVAVSAVGAAGVLALALLFLFGCWRRRSRPAPITPGSTDETLQL